jgi:hypothetical protein
MTEREIRRRLVALDEMLQLLRRLGAGQSKLARRQAGQREERPQPPVRPMIRPVFLSPPRAGR